MPASRLATSILLPLALLTCCKSQQSAQPKTTGHNTHHPLHAPTSTDTILRTAKPTPRAENTTTLSNTSTTPATIPPGARCLLAAYPTQLCSFADNTLTWCDGTTMIWDEHKPHPDHDHLLDHADLQDMMAQPYPRGRHYPIPLPENFEPGRIRQGDFFLKMYGDSARAVGQHMTTIKWMPKFTKKRLRVTTINDVHKKLEAVSLELQKLPPKLRKYALKTSGTFVWRKIGGTSRRSMHSFALAIDVGVQYSDYWRWNKPNPQGLYPYKNRMPIEIVEIFEKHGFIWGGKWYHFDTMHFEYRPELLHPDCIPNTNKKN